MCAAIQNINNKIRDILYITNFLTSERKPTSNQLAADQPNNCILAGTRYYNTIKNKVVAKIFQGYIQQSSLQFHLATTYCNQN